MTIFGISIRSFFFLLVWSFAFEAGAMEEGGPDSVGPVRQHSIEQARNVPVRLSVRFVDQFGNPAEGMRCRVVWCPGIWYKVQAPRGGEKVLGSFGDSRFEFVETDGRGQLRFERPNESGVYATVWAKDPRFSNVGMDYALEPSTHERYFQSAPGRLHVFDPDHPTVIRVWRYMGFQPLVIYDDRADNDLRCRSAAGEVRLDLTTFSPVESGGDVVIRWSIGAAVRPEPLRVVFVPFHWARPVHLSVEAVDGSLWAVAESDWSQIHGIVPEMLSSGHSRLDIDRILGSPGYGNGSVGHESVERFMLVSRRNGVCAKVAMNIGLDSPEQGQVRLRFANTIVNPAGPPSLEVQPSLSQEARASAQPRQRQTVIRASSRWVGDGPGPVPGPTADEAWAVYERLCAEQGITPSPRPRPWTPPATAPALPSR